MIGQIIERLKDPKNPVSTIIAGWVLAIIGYAIFVSWTVEPLGQIIGIAGVIVILVTLIRLSATKMVYAILCVIAVVVYCGMYAKKANWKSRTETVETDVYDTKNVVKAWTPHYSTGMTQKIMAAIFAPGAMGHVVWRSKYKGVGIDDHSATIDLSHSELREGVDTYKKRKGK